MKFISDTNELSHFGVPGMHWGRRRATNTIKRMEKYWDTKTAISMYKSHNMQKKADKTDNEARKSAYKGVAIKKSNDARETRNLLSGVRKARKMVDGMRMSQAISKIQTEAGYSKGQKILSRLLYNNTDTLKFATMTYATAVTKGGTIRVK